MWHGIVGRYAAGALLLDRHDPTRVIARSSQPIMTPITDFETNGFVPNVVFPTAMLDYGDNLQVFYGAADTCVAMAEFSKRAILDSMTTQDVRSIMTSQRPTENRFRRRLLASQMRHRNVHSRLARRDR